MARHAAVPARQIAALHPAQIVQPVVVTPEKPQEILRRYRSR